MGRSVTILIAMMFSTSAMAESFSLGQFKVVTQKGESAALSTISAHKMLVIEGVSKSGFILEKESAPESIDSVKYRLRDLKGNPKSLGYFKAKSGVIFHFTSPEGYHLYSTKGGYLFLSKELIAKSSDIKMRVGLK